MTNAQQNPSPVTWVGVDEAGYAPNLGPLVVTATVWESDETRPGSPGGTVASRCPLPETLWRRLSPAVCRVDAIQSPHRSGVNGDEGKPLLVGDSKKLYTPARGLGLLERGVLSLLGLSLPRPTFRYLVQFVGADEAVLENPSPWLDGYDVALPVAADEQDVLETRRRVFERMQRVGLHLRAVHSELVFPVHLNALVSKYDSKGAALAEVTSHLLRRAFGDAAIATAGNARVFVDRQGGRKNYLPMLQQTFPDDLVVCTGESRETSLYRLAVQGRPVEVCFQVGAECHLPVALASMVSKYLRELAMILFNRFWSGHVPNLKPTAGYPLDARRFAAAIRSKQQELSISDDVLWRVR